MPSQYFYLRPFDHEVTISSEPSPSGIWYAVWFQNGQPTWYAVWPPNTGPSWTEHRPALKNGQSGACVVAYKLPLANEVPVAGGSKEIPPPPWIQTSALTDFNSFVGAVEASAVPRIWDAKQPASKDEVVVGVPRNV